MKNNHTCLLIKGKKYRKENPKCLNHWVLKVTGAWGPPRGCHWCSFCATAWHGPTPVSCLMSVSHVTPWYTNKPWVFRKSSQDICVSGLVSLHPLTPYTHSLLFSEGPALCTQTRLTRDQTLFLLLVLEQQTTGGTDWEQKGRGEKNQGSSLPVVGFYGFHCPLPLLGSRFAILSCGWPGRPSPEYSPCTDAPLCGLTKWIVLFPAWVPRICFPHSVLVLRISG